MSQYVYIGNGGSNYVFATYWQTTSSASGTVTLKPGSAVKLDAFQDLEDALVSATSGGLPTFSAAVNGSGTRISCTFDSSGNYILSDTPSSYPVAIVWRVIISDSDIDYNNDQIIIEDIERPGGGGSVSSVFSRSGAITAATNDYTWAQINKATSDIADITTKSHTSLSDIGTNSHAQIDSHIANTSNPHSVTKTQVGLSNVDNTSDANKPVSTATQTALDNKMTNPMTTGGDIIYGGASGVPTKLSNGNSGQILTSSGGTAAPTWTTPAVSPTTGKNFNIANSFYVI